ncbi:hypothetical protein Tco_0045336, partial [Tanacetum coccineum]
VMAFSVMSISSDSSEESVGTSTARVILFAIIFTAVPATAPTSDLPVIHDDTLLIPTDTPTISPIIPTIPSIAPTIQYTSPFVCTDSSGSETLNTPPSQDPYEVTVTRWRSRVAAHSSPPSPIYDTPPIDILPSTRQILHAPPGLPRRPTVLVLPGQPIPVGRPYRTQPNGVLKMLIARKRMTYHEILYHPISDSPCDSQTATSAGPSRKRRRSLTTSVLIASPVLGALSLVRADLLPPRKRIMYFDFETDFEVSLEEAYVPGKDVRVEDGTAAEEEAESSARGMIEIRVDRVTHHVVLDDTAEPVREVPKLVSADGSLEVMQRGLDVVMQELYDHMVEISVHRVRVIKSVQRDQGHRIVATSQQSADMSERIGTLEQDNMRFRGMSCVERKEDTAYLRLNFTRKRVRSIPNTAYPTAYIRRIQLDKHSEIRRMEPLEAKVVGLQGGSILGAMCVAAELEQKEEMWSSSNHEESSSTLKIKTETMTKPTSENNTRTTYDSDIVTRKLNMETTIEIGYEFVKILQDNAFNRIDGADIVNHIAKVLEISKWIKIPNADKDQLRLHVFPISLSGRAGERWDNEIKDIQYDVSNLYGYADAIRRILGFGIQRIDYLYSDLAVKKSTITMPTTTHSGMTQDVINELIAKHVEEALHAYDTAKNPRTKTEIEKSNKITMLRSMVIMETVTVMGMETPM